MGKPILILQVWESQLLLGKLLYQCEEAILLLFETLCLQNASVSVIFGAEIFAPPKSVRGDSHRVCWRFIRWLTEATALSTA